MMKGEYHMPTLVLKLQLDKIEPTNAKVFGIALDNMIAFEKKGVDTSART